jgi:bifunctional N-acetylglucosamine-1-phosphate-uridyltransferase/glucosamine-1-phosphate-acetyltransferase GlmU-like protein
MMAPTNTKHLLVMIVLLAAILHLVAPVTVGSNATVAAGSVITKDVPDNGLGMGRAKQNNKENWSKKKD